MRLEKISKYARAKNPPPTKVTDRDTKIFAFIHDYGGMAAFRHLFDERKIQVAVCGERKGSRDRRGRH